MQVFLKMIFITNHCDGSNWFLIYPYALITIKNIETLHVNIFYLAWNEWVLWNCLSASYLKSYRWGLKSEIILFGSRYDSSNKNVVTSRTRFKIRYIQYKLNYLQWILLVIFLILGLRLKTVSSCTFLM